MSEFKKTLEEVEQFYYEQKANSATLIIMGDFNAHLKVYRSTQTLNARAKLLFAMLMKLNLCAVNTEAFCVGQTNTYISSCNVSMIDYIVIEKHLTPCINHVEIMDETPDNTAFHCYFCIWNLMRRMKYCYRVSSNELHGQSVQPITLRCIMVHLANLLPSEFSPQTLSETPDEIDAQVSLLCKAICQAGQAFPCVVYNKKIKPFWNDKVKSSEENFSTKI